MVMLDMADGEVLLALNACGERANIVKNCNFIFDNIMGAKIKIRNSGNETVLLEANMPDSAEPLFWEYKIENDSISPTRSSIRTNGSKNLHSLIWEAGVALNGKL